MSTSGHVPLLLDVDTGIDDAFAILYAVASPATELIAVTAVHGNVALEDTERNTRAVLELAGRSDVEVAAGRATPLLRPLDVSPETHRPHGLGARRPPRRARRCRAALRRTSSSRRRGSARARSRSSPSAR
ncbi:MAG: nucleoside hydrolase [Chloroflexota bacterium]